jgi:hypothetical protein
MAQRMISNLPSDLPLTWDFTGPPASAHQASYSCWFINLNITTLSYWPVHRVLEVAPASEYEGHGMARGLPLGRILQRRRKMERALKEVE